MPASVGFPLLTSFLWFAQNFASVPTHRKKRGKGIEGGGGGGWGGGGGALVNHIKDETVRKLKYFTI